MKLKKIVSLMLAGIMAVSMLAGCKGNTINEQPNEQPEKPTTSGYSAVFEDAMDPDVIADGKITMSDNADLTARLNKAIGNLSADTIDDFYNGVGRQAVVHFAAGGAGYADLRVIAELMDAENDGILPTQAFSGSPDMLADMTNVTTAKTVTLLYAVNSAVDANEAVEQIARRLDGQIGNLPINNDQQAAPTESVHFVYTGSVSVASKTLASDHGMGMHLIAVEITRTARG